jgi:hypothetical protein
MATPRVVACSLARGEWCAPVSPLLPVISPYVSMGLRVSVGVQPASVPAEDVRLQHRYVDLRRPHLQRNLQLRSHVNLAGVGGLGVPSSPPSSVPCFVLFGVHSVTVPCYVASPVHACLHLYCPLLTCRPVSCPVLCMVPCRRFSDRVCVCVYVCVCVCVCVCARA